MLKKRVGIPRGLLYYNYYPLWKEFLTQLGAEVILSPKTNKEIVGLGVRAALDETCLPVKLYYGHVSWLKDKVDLLFIPRIISVEVKEYICPKFMGLPDMIRANVSQLPGVIDTTLDMSKNNKNLSKFAREVGLYFTTSPVVIARAWQSALVVQKRYEELMVSQQLMPDQAIALLEQEAAYEPDNKHHYNYNSSSNLHLAVIGHSYNIYDEHISMNLIPKLQERGVKVSTSELLEIAEINQEAAKLPKRMFWTFGRKCIGSAGYLVNKAQVDGLIHVSSFGCGPDSMVGELILRKLRRETDLPTLSITIDEHTGEAGLVTRIEAYLDMLERRMAQ